MTPPRHSAPVQSPPQSRTMGFGARGRAGIGRGGVSGSKLRGIGFALALWLGTGLGAGLATGTTALAQDRAALIADQVIINAAGNLVASGGVQVFFRGATLRATAITYDAATDRLLITGPMTLVDPSGSILIADQADLSADLTQGILQSARLVLDRKLQIAAQEVERTGDRYTQMRNVVASSCKVCAGSETPLWEIRARAVTHDQEARQIYFDQAQFRISGVPVFYYPRLRMPDPTLDRASGFLMPEFRVNSKLGAGVKIPYFLTLGQSRDLTFTPYITSKDSYTMGLRYRQAFNNGRLSFEGSISRDQIMSGGRYALFGEGRFDLPRRYKLAFDIEMASDAAYLLDYGLPYTDRPTSSIELSRVTSATYLSARLSTLRSFRVNEPTSTQPSIITDLFLQRRFSGGPLGGTAGLTFQTYGATRTSSLTVDGPDTDTIADGRDLRRLSLGLDWRRDLRLPAGIMGSVMAELRGDIYGITQDAVFAGNTSRISGAIATEFRWPLARIDAGGASHLIEPVVQLVWARDRAQGNIPDEDSLLVEFDEGNLFSLNRFPGADAYELGRRVNLGLSYSYTAPRGSSLTAALGRVFRADDYGQFSASSGLDGRRSDWLGALQFRSANGLIMTHRMLLDNQASLSKSETRLALAGARGTIGGSATYLPADAAENRATAIRELALDGALKLGDNWTALGETRYNFTDDKAERLGLGLTYRSECVEVDFSVVRRFTTSATVKPATEFGLSVDLVGFGSGAAAGPSRRCGR